MIEAAPYPCDDFASATAVRAAGARFRRNRQTTLVQACGLEHMRRALAE
jgi:hypothetical protein